MANISFGQNILPKANNTWTLGNSDYKWKLFASQINGTNISDLLLPAVSSSDNGKILSVSSGVWAAITPSFLTSHQDISGKADKVISATSGNVATLDSNGNLVDSGKTLGTSVPSDAIFTDTTYSAATTSDAGLMSSTDKSKLDGITTMVGATSNAAGSAGLVPAPTTGDTQKVLCGDGTWQLRQGPMVVLSYGSSTWDNVLAAYLANAVVYCRASSNNDPATGSQTRMAFLAYVNDGANPTELEFQYYRSVSSHSATQMCDEVYVYKINKTNGWSVTKRQAGLQKITVGSGLSTTYSSNQITLNNTGLNTVGIVEDGYTASQNISDGQYVIWTVTLYTANVSITYGTTLSSSNLTAVSNGLGGEIKSLSDSKLDVDQGSINAGKYMKVSNDGSLVPDTVPNPQIMIGATSSVAGTSGLVPAPVSGDNDKFLKGDGTWGNVPPSTIVDLIYPIGSIYMSVASTSPGTLFAGTTWEQIKNKFFIGAADPEIPSALISDCETVLLNDGMTAEEIAEMSDYEKYTAAKAIDSTIRDLTFDEQGHAAGSTGGSATHTMTTDEMPSHTHTFTGNEVTTGENSVGHTHGYTDYYASNPDGTAISVAQLASHGHSFKDYFRASSNSSGNTHFTCYTGSSPISGTNNAGSGNTHTHTANNTSTSRTSNDVSANHTHQVTATGTISSTGSGNAFNIVPPYMAVYMWKRTA